MNTYLSVKKNLQHITHNEWHHEWRYLNIQKENKENQQNNQVAKIKLSNKIVFIMPDVIFCKEMKKRSLITAFMLLESLNLLFFWNKVAFYPDI